MEDLISCIESQNELLCALLLFLAGCVLSLHLPRK